MKTGETTSVLAISTIARRKCDGRTQTLLWGFAFFWPSTGCLAAMASAICDRYCGQDCSSWVPLSGTCGGAYAPKLAGHSWRGPMDGIGFKAHTLVFGS